MDRLELGVEDEMIAAQGGVHQALVEGGEAVEPGQGIGPADARRALGRGAFVDRLPLKLGIRANNADNWVPWRAREHLRR